MPRPSVGLPSELFGRHAHAAFEVLDEERRIGKVELVGDLLNGEMMVRFQQVFRVQDHRMVDPPSRAVPRYAVYDRGEVFGRYAELVGVESDFAFIGVMLRNQNEELTEHRLLPRLGAHSQRFAVLIDVEDFVIEHHRHMTGDLFTVGMAVLFEFSEHPAIFEHAFERTLFDRDAGIVLDVEKQRGRRRYLHFPCDVHFGYDAVCLEIIAPLVDLHDHVGKEYADVALLDMALPLVECNTARSL